MIPAIYLKLRLRTPIPLSPDTFKLAVDFFRKNPDRDCYVIFDGRVVGGDTFPGPRFSRWTSYPKA